MQLRPRQRAAIDALYDYFAVEDGNPLVVAPTGTGKSVIIGAFVREAMTRYKNQRILMLTHVKELIEQNHEKLLTMWPEAPAGIYCAGLGMKDFDQPIVYASIQSVHRKADLIGYRHLVIIDEAHLLSKDTNTMYRRFIKDLQGYNPKLKVIGFTATPYRTKSGMLHMGKDALFTDIAYNIPILDELKDGNLSKLVTKESGVQGDNSSLVTVGGEYTNKSMEAAYDNNELTKAVVQECLKHGRNRKAWLFFCSGIKHALHMRDELRDYGIEAQTITGDTPAVERAHLIEEFKAGKIRALTNANVLTTGFDYPAIDLIALVRPTKSPGLYVQMVGRGLRTAPEKENCLILDFAGNIDQHGPITHVKPPPLKSERKLEKKEEEDWKLCKVCGTVNEVDAEVCFDCGTTFVKERKIKHEKEASTASIISDAVEEKDKWYKVDGVDLKPHTKADKTSLKVTYYCGFDKFSEWICLEHEGFARQKAQRWWREYGERPVERVQEAIFSGIKPISEIRVRTDGKYPEILDRRIKSDAKEVLELQRGSLGQQEEPVMVQPMAIPSA